MQPSRSSPHPLGPVLSFLRTHQTRLVVAAAVGGVAITSLAVGVVVMQRPSQQPIDTVATARALIDADKPAAALELLAAGSDDSPERTELEIEATTQRRDVFKLAALYDVHPEAVSKQDDASQIIARSAMVSGDAATTDELIAQWEGTSDEPHAWLCMKADRHLRSGEFDAARELLESQTFDGAADGGRQLRLAMLEAADDPIVALERINAFLMNAPKHGDAHLMRAQLLEGLQRLPEARVSFVTALAAAPENPFYRYELASFYRRRGDLRFALRTWQDSLTLPRPAPGWLKTLFWSRVAHPSEATFTDEIAVSGRLGELVEFIAGLDEGVFFDDAAFSILPSSRALTRRHQEVYWLRILELLRTGDDAEAQNLLSTSRFAEQSWNALLEESLRSLLRFRTEDRPTYRTARSFQGRGAASVHPFIAALQPEDRDDISEEFAAFLKSPDAIPMTLIACGWMEAALRMPHSDVCPDAAPHHMAYAMTQAYRSNRDDTDAMRFAMRQPESPALDVAIGEMHLARGEHDAALQMWRLAAADSGAAGYRASWMLAVELLGRDRLDEAERTINRHLDLAAATIGKELLARIALRRGDVDKAVAIYDAIASDSIDARLFAIQRRLARGTDDDIAEAQAIGDQLFAVHPDVPSVRRLVLQLSDLANSRTN